MTKKLDVGERLKARIGKGNIRIRIEVDKSLQDGSLLLYGSKASGGSSSDDVSSSTSSVEDDIERVVEELTSKRAWPQSIDVKKALSSFGSAATQSSSCC